jgi:hypothetical protein
LSLPAAVARSLEAALYSASVAAYQLSLATSRLVVEIPTALHSPLLERAMLRGFYAHQSKYRDPQNQRSGLLPFEERMLERFFPRPPARILLHGAGGGRELGALQARGYDVTAFEPVPALVDAANREYAAGSDMVQCASVQDWDRWLGGQYDGVFTGWALWTHLIRESDRLSALRAFSEVCPRGPVLLSFFSSATLFDEFERKGTLPPLQPEARGRLTRLTRYWLRQRLLHLPPLERGTGWGRGFYYHEVHPAELEEEAAQTRWRVAYYERDPYRYPHAVLLPADAPNPRL